MTEQQLEWTVERETCAELLLQGAHPWQIVNSMVELDVTEEAHELIAEVRQLWGQEATGGQDPALDENMAQLRRVRRLAWEKWQKTDRDPRTLKLVRDTELEIYDLSQRVSEVLGDAQRDEEIQALPAWVPTYLAAWGSKRPDGKRVTLTWAARLAGTIACNVRQLRRRSGRFREMEYIARHGEGEHIATMISGGLRGNAAIIFESFMRLVGRGNPQAVLKGMEWLQNRPTILFQVATMTDDELLSYYSGLLEKLTDSGGGDTAPGPDIADSTGVAEK